MRLRLVSSTISVMLSDLLRVLPPGAELVLEGNVLLAYLEGELLLALRVIPASLH